MRSVVARVTEHTKNLVVFAESSEGWGGNYYITTELLGSFAQLLPKKTAAELILDDDNSIFAITMDKVESWVLPGSGLGRSWLLRLNLTAFKADVRVIEVRSDRTGKRILYTSDATYRWYGPEIPPGQYDFDTVYNGRSGYNEVLALRNRETGEITVSPRTEIWKTSKKPLLMLPAPPLVLDKKLMFTAEELTLRLEHTLQNTAESVSKTALKEHLNNIKILLGAF